MVMSFRGLDETGRPPFLTTARSSMSSVSCGSSAYSLAFTTCASTRDRLDLKERRDTRFFTDIGFPHAKYVSFLATLRATDHHHPTHKVAVTDNADFSVVLAVVLNLKSGAFKNVGGVLKR